MKTSFDFFIRVENYHCCISSAEGAFCAEQTLHIYLRQKYNDAEIHSNQTFERLSDIRCVENDIETYYMVLDIVKFHTQRKNSHNNSF